MHQYLFHIGDFPIRMYGLMLTLAIFLATGTAYFLARQDGRWHEHVLDIGIYGGNVKFEYSPPGASNLPVNIILMASD